MMETIVNWDKELFLLIHLGAQNAVLDLLAPLFREKLFWSPLYLFFIVYIWMNARKLFWPFAIAILTLVTATDTMSSKVVKPSFGRLRPCKELVLKDQVRNIVPCGSGFSFTSSHAANHFGLAAFMVMGIAGLHRRYRWLWYVWAGLVGFSQIYVGVHYPLDILGGACLGLLLGWLWSIGFKRYLLKYQTEDI